MAVPAEKLELTEADSEYALLGSFLVFPATLDVFAAELSPEWFGDPFARYLFEAALVAVAQGTQLSIHIFEAALPEQCGPVTRRQLITRCAGMAMPANALRGLVEIIKDRWARRTLMSAGMALQDAAARVGQPPFESADIAMDALDSVHAVRAGATRGSMLGDAAAALVASHDNPDAMRGHTTGLAALDKKLNGYVRGQFYIVGARPGMGKSALLTSSLRRTAQSGVGVAAFSLEMTGLEVASRCISDMFNDPMAPTFGALQRGAYDPMWRGDLEAAATALNTYPMLVDDTASLSMAEISSRARRAKSRFEAEGRKLGVVAIDHAGLVRPSGRYSGNRVAENGETSNLCRALAKELDCCVLAFVQLSRNVEEREDKRPALPDLRWSGDFEQDAHVVMFLFRQHYYLQRDPFADPAALSACRWQLDCIIGKNRNGATEDVRLWCSIAHASIRDE